MTKINMHKCTVETIYERNCICISFVAQKDLKSVLWHLNCIVVFHNYKLHVYFLLCCRALQCAVKQNAMYTPKHA